jgi:hypothetical protein
LSTHIVQDVGGPDGTIPQANIAGNSRQNRSGKVPKGCRSYLVVFDTIHRKGVGHADALEKVTIEYWQKKCHALFWTMIPCEPPGIDAHWSNNMQLLAVVATRRGGIENAGRCQ